MRPVATLTLRKSFTIWSFFGKFNAYFKRRNKALTLILQLTTQQRDSVVRMYYKISSYLEVK